MEDGETCHVNSRHHQSVKQAAKGFEVTATSPDGVIEAMEKPDAAFCVAVQWHPENFWRTGEFRELFEGLVQAAAKRAKEITVSTCAVFGNKSNARADTHSIAGIEQHTGVTRERGNVARHINESRGIERDRGGERCFRHAGPRRIDDHRRRPLAASIFLDTGISNTVILALRVAMQIAGREQIAFDGRDRSGAGRPCREAEQADPGIEIDQRAVADGASTHPTNGV